MPVTLTQTSLPKPGSSLSNITVSFDYDFGEDLNWNKPTSATDGEGNITTFAYDETQGTLLTITRPEIDSEIPTVVYTYTARGQVETVTEETEIVTKFEYDETNETLLTAIRDFGDGRLNLTTHV